MKVAIYNRWLATLGGGERESLTIAEMLASEHDVEILSPSRMTAHRVNERLGIDLSRAKFVELSALTPRRLSALSSRYDLFINCSHWDYVHARAQRNVLLVFFPYHGVDNLQSRLRYWSAHLLGSRAMIPLTERLEKPFPGIGQRVQNPIQPDFRRAVATYGALWAISEFTQDWIARYWSRESHLLYPPVAIEDFRAAAKRRRILHVGRFFAGSHNKKHATLIDAFKQLVDQGLQGWTLTLAGGSTPGEQHQTYLAALRRQAQGYPIEFRVGAPYADLVNLYAESSIYWHASGYGEDAEHEPHRLEHFGITTVEAMAAECVPVVIGLGGQRELITHGSDGFLWYTTPELLDYSRALADNPSLRKQMGEQAARNAHKFGRIAFERRLSTLLEQLK